MYLLIITNLLSLCIYEYIYTRMTTPFIYLWFSKADTDIEAKVTILLITDTPSYFWTEHKPQAHRHKSYFVFFGPKHSQAPWFLFFDSVGPRHSQAHMACYVFLSFA